MCGDRGLALYVTLCQWNKNLCCQVLMCLQNCCSCFTDNCSVITSDYMWILFYLPDVNQFFFVSADVYLVQNQTVTVQNGPNFREIFICLRDLLSCLMLCYRVYFVSICLQRQANSTSYYTCMLSDIFLENVTVIYIVAGFCKF